LDPYLNTLPHTHHPLFIILQYHHHTLIILLYYTYFTIASAKYHYHIINHPQQHAQIPHNSFIPQSQGHPSQSFSTPTAEQNQTPSLHSSFQSSFPSSIFLEGSLQISSSEPTPSSSPIPESSSRKKQKQKEKSNT
jgi:hypothetical protein